jgi:hypothetical protein
MTISPQLDYVKREIDREIGTYTHRKHYNRRAAFAFTVVPASLAAFATVAIGASDRLKIDWLPLLAMVATGIASILGAWEALFSNRKLWRVNNLALTSLYEVKADIEFRELDPTKPISEAEVGEFFQRLKAVRAEGEAGYQKAVGHE